MRSEASSWNQGELECFVRRWGIPGDIALTLETCNTVSLRSGRLAFHHNLHWCSHFILMSAGFVTLVLRICVSTPFAPVVGCSWPLSCYPLEHICPTGFRSPSSPLPIVKSHVVIAYAPLRWSILATWTPHFHRRLWATATMSLMLVLFVISAFATMSFHTFYLPLTKAFLAKLNLRYVP
jgi:hypothetical protein